MQIVILNRDSALIVPFFLLKTPDSIDSPPTSETKLTTLLVKDL